jgi:acyl-CoA thioesterase FadM
LNLFFRLCIILLGAGLRRAPCVPVLSPTRRSFSVWITDQDAFGHMTNSRYFSLTDLAMLDYMLKTGALSVARRHGWLPIVSFEDIAFHKMLKFPQRFTIETRLVGWTDAYMVFTHRFCRETRCHADGLTLARFVTRQARAVPIADVARAFSIDGPSPPLPPEATEACRRLSIGRCQDNATTE